MPVNPHVKGGADVPVADGGTGASVAATGLSNLGGLDAVSHAAVSHAGIPGVGDLTSAAHSVLDHSSTPGVGIVLQRVRATSSATVATSAGQIPWDATPPLIGEGNTFLSVPITPTNALNKIRVRARLQATTDGASHCVIFVYKNGDSQARRVGVEGSHGTEKYCTVMADFEMVAGSTAAQTWYMRFGPTLGDTIRVNSSSFGTLLGGLLSSWLEVEEIRV